jgi:ketosteroid isomerase-like protein
VSRFSEQNVEIVRRLAERINAGDIDGMLRLISPEIEYRTRENEPDAGVFRGQEEFAKFADSWLGAFDEYQVEIYEYIDAGEYVVVPGRARGRGRTSGIAVDAEETWVWRIRDGKAVECCEYANKAEALEAVGLIE